VQVRDIRCHHRDRNLDRRARSRSAQSRYTDTNRREGDSAHRRGDHHPPFLLTLERTDTSYCMVLVPDLQAQPHLPSGAVRAGDTTTAARAEAEQPTAKAAQAVHETAEHAKGVAEHAASTAHVRTSLLPASSVSCQKK